MWKKRRLASDVGCGWLRRHNLVFTTTCLSVCGQKPHTNAHTVCRRKKQWERGRRLGNLVDAGSEKLHCMMNLITLLFVVFLLGPSLSKGRRGGRLSKAEQSIGSSVRHRCSILNLDQLYHHPTQAWPSHQQEGHQLQLGGGERHFPLENRHQSELGLKMRLRSKFCFSASVLLLRNYPRTLHKSLGRCVHKHQKGFPCYW